MRKTILQFGLISGVLCSLMMAATMPFQKQIGFDRAEFAGYTLIVLSFLLVFFGIRSWRDTAGNGHISFARGFAVGIGITLITCVCYVVTWEIMYFNFMHSFMDDYSAYLIARLRASGAGAAAIRSQMLAIQRTRQLYENPLYNCAITFLEPFPIGLAITLLSALLLRKSPQTQPGKTATLASD